MATQGIRASGGIQYRDNNTVVAVTAYGAKGDGVTDDTAAITAAVAAANATVGSAHGGVVYFPPGTYKCASPLALSNSSTRLQQVRLVGAAGAAIGNPYGSSTILYTGTGSTSFMQLNYARYVSLENLSVQYSSSSFTGILVDFSVPTVDINIGGTNNLIAHCNFGSSDQVVADGVFNASSLVSFSNTYGGKIVDSHFAFAKIGVTLAATASDAANSHRIKDNRFDNLITAGIVNAAESVSITGNAFEPGTLGGVTMYPAYLDNRTTPSFPAQSLSFSWNWVGDGDGSTKIFDTGTTTAYALNIVGNQLGGGSVKLNSVIGGRFNGNFLTAAVVFSIGGTYVGLDISNNTFTGIAPTWTNLPASVSLRANNRDTATSNTGDNFIVDTIDAGHVGPIQIGAANANQIYFFTGGSQRWTVDGNASMRPAADNVYTVGDSTHLPSGVYGYWHSSKLGAVLPSASTITPTSMVHHVSGTAAIATISTSNLPTGFAGPLYLIPDGVFTTTTGGNISLASTAVVNKTLVMTWDGTKWNPSY